MSGDISVKITRVSKADELSSYICSTHIHMIIFH